MQNVSDQQEETADDDGIHHVRVMRRVVNKGGVSNLINQMEQGVPEKDWQHIPRDHIRIGELA